MKPEAIQPVGLAMAMFLMAVAPSWAEQISSKADSTKSTQSQSTHTPAWWIKDALPDNTKPLATSEPEPKTKPTIGRMPLRSGSVGFETDPKIKSMEFPGGQKVPGYEASGRQPPSYLGFSLSVPTSN